MCPLREYLLLWSARHTHSDNLEEVFENREHIAISKDYEKLPKPTLMAIQEFDDNKIYYRNPTEIAE